MIPICLITGFLGSGKTTLLKHLIQKYRDRRIVFLVNEFSSTDVDGVLLSKETDYLEPIVGGSIFCRCLVSQFIQVLERLPSRFGSPQAPVEGVIIEASGMANPRVAALMLQEARLDQQYRLASVVSVVDPGSFLKLIHTLPNIPAQVEAADLVLINKIDLYPKEQIERTEAALLEIQPRLKPKRVNRCQIELDLFRIRSHQEAAGEYARCRDPHFLEISVQLKSDLDLDGFRAALEKIRDEIYRVKGFVRAGGAWYYIDFSASGFHAEKSTLSRSAELVFILNGTNHPKARRLAVSLQRGKKTCLFQDGPIKSCP